MSTRQIRRMRELQVKEQAPAEPQSDDSDDFAPCFTKVREPNKNSFKALKQKKKKVKKQQDIGPSEEDKLSKSEDDSEIELSPAVIDDESDPESNEEKKVRNTNNKKKTKKSKKSTSNHSDSDDSVERAVAEVNKLLGGPAPQPEQASLPQNSSGEDILQIEYKYLDPKIEFSRLVGPPDDDEPRNRRDNTIIMKRRIGVLETNRIAIEFKGLSMEKVHEEADIKFFKFTHEPRYEKKVRRFIAEMMSVDLPQIRLDFERHTFEEYLQMVDVFFRADESREASRCVDSAITYIQTLFAPSFNYFDGKTRLPYVYVENRPFHVLLLKYMYLLTNKACHRTALEVCKLQLNLDSRDPVALVLVLDVLALRAREYDWFLDQGMRWVIKRDAIYLFNMLYSRSLAHYYLHSRTKEPADRTKADEYLKFAIQCYPNVAVIILKFASRDVTAMTSHALYKITQTATSKSLLDLQQFHCRLVWPNWREANGALAWLADTFTLVAQEYELGTCKSEIEKAAKRSSALFKRYPIQVKRHLSIISSMSQLIADGTVPQLERTLSANPFPELGESEDPKELYRSRIGSLLDYVT